MLPIDSGPFRVLADLGFQAIDPYPGRDGYLYLVMQRIAPANLLVDYSHGWAQAEICDGRPTVAATYWRGALTVENAAAVVDAVTRSLTLDGQSLPNSAQ